MLEVWDLVVIMELPDQLESLVLRALPVWQDQPDHKDHKDSLERQG